MRYAVPIATGDGEFTAWFSEHGLVGLDFPGRPSPSMSDARSGPAPNARWLQLTADALRAVLAGKKMASLPPFDWRGATEFQQTIWRAMQRIPPGQTRTYAQLAADAGRPRAVRATGGACGANPIPVLVPCHRVVASGGRLGGFSGGLDWKRLLLAREQGGVLSL
jgi:O-6-methylguanine DNA methyltransferase